MARKIIQISAVETETGDPSVFALTDDSKLYHGYWKRKSLDEAFKFKWCELENVPQIKEEKLNSPAAPVQPQN